MSATIEDINETEEARRAAYAAFASGDARYDGRLFVGVKSTGIYCRTVCKARLPKFENCSFYHTAAEAEAAGFRPCMTCRPEVAPGMAPVDARSSLARRAAVLLRDNCASSEGVERLAQRLGYTDRHLRRVFAEEYGVTPVQYLQTCRLLLAKSLLTDTDIPVSRVALAAGFGSARRMNELFKSQYRMTPTDVRKGRRGGGAVPGAVTLHLGYRPPYPFEELLSFFRTRAIERIEAVDERSYSRTVRLCSPTGDEVTGWVRVEDAPSKSALRVSVSDSLIEVLPQVAGRIRRQFDLDCDPQAIAAGLVTMGDAVSGCPREGTRLPGCFDAFETTCRAVIGQQVTVKAASNIASRIAAALGVPIDTDIEGLDRAWPAPAEVVNLKDPESAFGEQGLIKSRTRSIVEIARLVEEGSLTLSAAASADEQMQRLLAVKGIGPWTANYIAMRVLAHPDAFLESDVGVAHALPELTPKERLALAEQWRPWRSYAVINLWNSL